MFHGFLISISHNEIVVLNDIWGVDIYIIFNIIFNIF